MATRRPVCRFSARIRRRAESLAGLRETPRILVNRQVLGPLPNFVQDKKAKILTSLVQVLYNLLIKRGDYNDEYCFIIVGDGHISSCMDKNAA
jgi:hypothetical protein